MVMIKKEETPKEEEKKPVKLEIKARQDFYEELKDAKQSVQLVLANMSKFNISFGTEVKTLDEWSVHFNIRIPEDPTMETLYRAMSQVNSLFGDAQKLHDEAALTRASIAREIDDKTASLFTQLKGNKGRSGPSNEAVEKTIKSKLNDLHNQLMIADFVVNFFHQRKLQLINTRKICEAILYGKGAELRNLSRSIDTQEEGDSLGWT